MAIARLTLQDNFSGNAQKVGDSIVRLKDGMVLTAQANGRFTDSMGQVVNGLKMVPDKVKAVSTSTAATVAPTTAMGDAMGFLSGKLQASSLSMSWFEMAFIAASAAVGAGIAVITAMSVTLVGMMYAAIESADALDQLTNTMDALTGDGQGSVDMIKRLTAALPFAKSQIKDWAIDLAKTGLKGKELEQAINAVAASAAILGDGGVGMTKLLKNLQTMSETGQKLPFNKIAKQMAEAGLNADDLAKSMGKTTAEISKMSAADLSKAIQTYAIKKGASALKDLMKDLGTTVMKVKGGFMSAFSGLGKDIDPLLYAIKDLAAAFGVGGTGTSMFAAIVKTILVPSFKVATMAVKALHVVISTLINWVLRAYIAFKQFQKSAVGSVVLKVLFAALVVVVAICVVVFLALAAALAVVVGIIAAVIGIVAAVIGAFVFLVPTIIGLIVGLVVGVVAGIVTLIAVFWDFISETASAFGEWVSGAASAAYNFVAGLASGIASGAGMVYDAIRTLAQGAISTLKGALGIASPSKVMIGMGKFTGQGMAEGIKSQHGAVAAASGGMGSAATGGASQGQASGGKSGGANITVAAGAVVINGVGSSGEALTLTESALALLLERVALSRGLVTP